MKAERWLAVLRWAQRVGARVTFTLNGMAGLRPDPSHALGRIDAPCV